MTPFLWAMGWVLASEAFADPTVPTPVPEPETPGQTSPAEPAADPLLVPDAPPTDTVPPAPSSDPATQVDLTSVVPAVTPTGEREEWVWGGLGMPLFGVNSTDGVGFGIGGEVFARPKGWNSGYRLKFTTVLWATLGFKYTSNNLWIDYRGRGVQVLGRVGGRTWESSLYAGNGGTDVMNRWGKAESGHVIQTPIGFVAVLVPIKNTPLRFYTQGFFQYVYLKAAEGSLLDQRRPFGWNGGTYTDVTLGIELEDVDTWPMPNDGVRGEIDARFGGTFNEDGFAPLVGVHTEVIGWHTAWDRVAFAGRLSVEKSFGPRPVFAQDTTAGRWRDELGMEQLFTGYGRWRVRGDGLVAALGEVRPKVYHLRHPFFDIGFYLSAYAEIGWLFDHHDPGPALPTVGGGPVLLWKGAALLRPFISVGWRTNFVGDQRHPDLQYGVSFIDPL